MILFATAAYLAIGLCTYVAWQVSGNAAWIDSFFHGPGALLMVALSGVQLVYAVRVSRRFSHGEPLQLTWHLISVSAVCDLLGALAVQLLSAHSAWNPLAHVSGWSRTDEIVLLDWGHLAGGSLRFSFLAAGLLRALGVYRQSGFLARLKPVDWVVLSAVVAYIGREAHDLWVALEKGKHPGWAEIAGWPVDPLLCALLAEAILLYRSARRMGPGWIGRSWVAFSAGIVLVILGDFSIWAFNYGYLPYPWSNIEWYLWLPASAAFAMAPVYQLEVIQKATAE